MAWRPNLSIKAAIGALACALSLGNSPLWAQESVYGCAQLASGHKNASVEGRDGVFFRVNPDMRNFVPMPPEVVDDIATLSETLAAQGTTLIFAQVPTKALAMQGHLTLAARDLGYDPDIATTIYLDGIRRLKAAGVLATEAQAELMRTPLPFFKTDHRLTAQGARAMAKTIGNTIKATSNYSAFARNTYETQHVGEARVTSALRPQLQQRCEGYLPEVRTALYQTAVKDRAQTGETGEIGVIALVGTEYSDTPEANFAGFLAQETGFDVIQYSLASGGAFGAISTYLTSREFQTARPDYLIWELPVYANLGANGPQPMQELIAASGQTCTFEIALDRDRETPNVFRGSLDNLPEGGPHVLLADFDGAAARSAILAFYAANGEARVKTVTRHPKQVPTGRFFVPMDGLWSEGAQQVELTVDVEVGGEPTLFACSGGER